MSADVMDGDEPIHKKQRLNDANSTSLDEDLDAFDELANQDPIESSLGVLNTPSSSAAAAAISTNNNSNSLPTGSNGNGVTLTNGGPSSQQQQQHTPAHPQMAQQSHTYYGAGPSSASNPHSQGQAQHQPQQHSSGSSVLQELLLQGTSGNPAGMNSPRPSYAPSSTGPSVPPNAYPTRSPMTTNAMPTGAGPPSVAQNMLSPPTGGMGALHHQQQQLSGGSNQQQRMAQFQRQQAISANNNKYELQAGAGPYQVQQPPPGPGPGPGQQMGGPPLPPNSVGYGYHLPHQQPLQQQRGMHSYSSPGEGMIRGPPGGHNMPQQQQVQQIPVSRNNAAGTVAGSPAPPLSNNAARGTRQGASGGMPMGGSSGMVPGGQAPQGQIMVGGGGVHPHGMGGMTPQQVYEHQQQQQNASPYQQPPQRQPSLGDSASYLTMQQGAVPPQSQQHLPMHLQQQQQPPQGMMQHSQQRGLGPQGAMMGGPGAGGVPAPPPVSSQMMPAVMMDSSSSMMVMAGGSGLMQMNGAPQKGQMMSALAQQQMQPTMGGGGVAPPQQAPMLNGPMMRSAPLGQGSNSSDQERRKLIQQQLVLLLHAHKCQQREKQARDQNPQQPNLSNCTVPFCTMMKSVLEHMTQCSNGRQCIYAHCASSRQIIMHWKNCSKDDCPVCKPVKSFSANPNDRRHGELLMNSGQFVTSSYQPHFIGGGGPPPPTAIGGGGMPSSVGAPNQHGSVGPGSVLSMSAFGSPPSTNAVVNNLLNDYNPSNPASMNPFRSTNPPNKIGQPNAIGVMGVVGSGMVTPNSNNSLICPPPDPPSQQKEWHDSITPDLRMHLVSKLVKAIFPSPDPSALQDQRIRDLISYAKKVEKDMFESASDKEEYYHLLAEKIYKIQKELQEKKTRRETQQGRMPLDGPAPLPGGPDGGVGMARQSQLMDVSFGGAPNTSGSQYQPQQGINMRDIKMEQGSLLYSAAQQSQNGLAANDPLLMGRSIKVEERGVCAAMPSTSSDATVSSSMVDAKPVVSRHHHPIVHHEELPVEEKVFDANELRNHLKPVWDKLFNAEEAMPFRVPVDPDQLKIPDYFDIIKRPIDLSTILGKLNNGDYRNPWEFCDNMWLMFENAWLYNRKNSKVYKYCTKLSEIFVDEINPVMRQMGYCCGQKLTFTPLPLICYGEGYGPCMIARDQDYMFYETSSNQYGVNVTEKFIYCLKCFQNLPPEGINLSDNPNDQKSMVPKAAFKQLKNDQIDPEPFENCKVCQRRWHRICALYSKKVYPEGYICELCRQEKSRPKPENKFTAKKLPHCQLSRYIEDRVNSFIDTKLPPGEKEEVIIRVLCTAEKEVEVRPYMKQKYGPEGFPDRFPYRTKAIFAFEMVDGVEVCFFGLHVQEYGSRSKTPNMRRVYIAYLDSVHFFQPRYLRTDVYHEILLGYLQYVKDLGYTMAHIWACPPSEGDDYIFHCHPPEQKIPKPKRLQEWYKKMLEKGHEERTVHEYKDIYKQARDDEMTTPMSLPYFEGDYWPNIIEDCIREAEREESEKKQQQAIKHEEDDDDDIFQTDDGKASSKKNSIGGGSSKASKKNNKSKKQSKKKSGIVGTGNQITDKLFSHLEKHKEVFFTIRLVSLKETKVLEREVSDPDPLIPSELMDGRDTFLSRAREEHWEFSSLRRAKWSTMSFTYALHTQDSKVIAPYECNRCKQPANWHCEHCDQDPGFDLCENCYKQHKNEHPHEMVPVKQVFSDVGSKSTDSSATARSESVQRCINSLVHACKCKDANCRKVTCHKMKKVVQHARMCKKRALTNACPVCKQLIALCCYHAKHCMDTSCPVPFCSNIRQKLQEQRRMQNRRADMMMRRRMENMNSGMNGPGGMQPQQPQPSTSSASASHQFHHGVGVGGMGGVGAMGSQQQQQVMGMAGGVYTQHTDGRTSQQHPMHPSQQQPFQQQQPFANGPTSGGGNGGSGGGIPPSYQLVNGQVVQQHQGVGIMGQMGAASYQPPPHSNMPSHPVQRVPSQQHLMHQQQPMNPPPYGRQSAQPSQQYANMSSNSPGAYSNSPQMAGGKGGPMMARPGSSSSAQMRGIPPQAQQDQTRIDPQMAKILARMHDGSQEEKGKILAELKKTPHLTAAFLKLTKDPNQMMRQQQQHWVVQDQYQRQQQQLPPHQQQQQQQQSRLVAAQQQQQDACRMGGGGGQTSYNNPPSWQRPPSQQ